MKKKNILAIAVAVLLATGVAGRMAIASSHGEGDVDAATLARAKIGLTQAIATAEKQTGGRAVSAEINAKEDTPRIEVETVGPKGAETVVVDAQSGLVTATRAGEQDERGGESDQD